MHRKSIYVSPFTRRYYLARRQDSVTGGEGAEINFGGGHEKFIYVNSMGVRGHEKLKKGLCLKISTNSGCRLKILAIFLEFWRYDQKKKVFVPKLKRILV